MIILWLFYEINGKKGAQASIYSLFNQTLLYVPHIVQYVLHCFRNLTCANSGSAPHTQSHTHLHTMFIII